MPYNFSPDQPDLDGPLAEYAGDQELAALMTLGHTAFRLAAIHTPRSMYGTAIWTNINLDMWSTA